MKTSILTAGLVITGFLVIGFLSLHLMQRAQVSAVAVAHEAIAAPAPDTNSTVADPVESPAAVDLTASSPTDSAPSAVKKIYSPILKGTFHSGIIPIVVVFDRPVIVTGTPKLILRTGGGKTTAVSLKSSSGDRLYFAYHIAQGDSANPLDYSSSGAIDLNGGSIKDASGNDVGTTLPEPGSSTSLSHTSKIIIQARTSDGV
jgi:hypothetical protein